ncbi:MAG: glutathione S-transferase N-terminal domain-containing protein [Myxococcota bacterium]
MHRALDVASSLAATLARAAGGLSVGRTGRRPEQPVILYEFESCPYCRKVREALTVLDLEAEIRPCPKGGHRFRDEVIQKGGKAQFPYLVDPNTGKAMYESDDIVRYLVAEYGDGAVPWNLTGIGPVVTGSLASALRLGMGSTAEASNAPAKRLELWSFEASPFSRIAREKLCTLELPYLLHNVGKGSASRPALAERAGKVMVPYLADPNTGVEMFESADIVAYLDETYGA